MLVEDPHRKKHQDDADGYRINNHRFGIELQMLLVTSADAGYADNQQRHHLTVEQMTVLVHVHQLDAVMDVNENAAPMIQHIGVYGILEELNYEGNVYESTKYFIKGLEVFAFFHTDYSSLFNLILIMGRVA